MATLTFFFAQMGAGKTEALMSSAYHSEQAGIRTVVATTQDRELAKVRSRLGGSRDAVVLDASVSPRERLLQGPGTPPQAVLIDEAQFLLAWQVDELCALVDEHDIDVICYGLRADAFEQLFTGSARLFAIADRVCELQLQARCWCGQTATHNARTSAGEIVRSGTQVQLDDGQGDITYEPLCRSHFRSGLTRHQQRTAA